MDSHRPCFWRAHLRFGRGDRFKPAPIASKKFAPALLHQCPRENYTVDNLVLPSHSPAVRVAGNVVRWAAHARACGEVLTVAHDGEHDAHCVQARLRSAISGGMLEEGEVVEEEAAPHMTAAAGVEVEPLHPGAAESRGGSGALSLPLADGALAAASDCAPPSAALAHDAEAHRKRAPAAREEPDRSRREAGAGTCDGALALPPGWTQHWS
ncbi:MAG: hypothetical protein ACPIOQ_18435, partial [Promethearchaeia archaeon]